MIDSGRGRLLGGLASESLAAQPRPLSQGPGAPLIGRRLGHGSEPLEALGDRLAATAPLSISQRSLPIPTVSALIGMDPVMLAKQGLGRVGRTAPDGGVHEVRRGSAPGSAGLAPNTLVFARIRRRAALPLPPPPPQPKLQFPAFPADADEGIPLVAEHRNVMEPFVGSASRDARIHAGEGAAAIAASLRAEAFTIGRDVFFGRGKFEPGTPRGRALLAHELVHVRQQTSQHRGIQRFRDDRDSLEAEAEQVERNVLTASETPAGTGLTIESYVRQYLTTDGRPISDADRARLDAMAQRALQVCEDTLGPVLTQSGDRTLGDLTVDLTLDLSLGNDAGAETWGRALADAIRPSLTSVQE